MSLEAAILANTKAVEALTAAMLGTGTAAIPAGVVAGAKAAATPPAGKTETAPAALDYEKDIKPLALRVAKEKSRDVLIEVLKGFDGAAKADQVKAEQWPALVKKLNEALAA